MAEATVVPAVELLESSTDTGGDDVPPAVVDGTSDVEVEAGTSTRKQTHLITVVIII